MARNPIGSIEEIYAGLEDPRIEWNKVHKLLDIIIIAKRHSIARHIWASVRAVESGSIPAILFRMGQSNQPGDRRTGDSGRWLSISSRTRKRLKAVSRPNVYMWLGMKIICSRPSQFRAIALIPVVNCRIYKKYVSVIPLVLTQGSRNGIINTDLLALEGREC